MISHQEKEKIMWLLNSIKECLKSQVKVNETMQKTIGVIDERLDALEEAFLVCYKAIKTVAEKTEGEVIGIDEEELHNEN